MIFNPEHHHRKSIRLKGYDYSTPGLYFVTICTHGKEHYFGEIETGRMHLTEIGCAVKKTWEELPEHNNVLLDSFIIMPNHIHAIVQIVGAGSKPARAESGSPEISEYGADLDSAPTKKTTLPEIVRQLKTFSIWRIKSEMKLWQRNYYEHIIRDNNELIGIRKYIEANILEWDNDEYNLSVVKEKNMKKERM